MKEAMKALETIAAKLGISISFGEAPTTAAEPVDNDRTFPTLEEIAEMPEETVVTWLQECFGDDAEISGSISVLRKILFIVVSVAEGEEVAAPNKPTVKRLAALLGKSEDTAFEELVSIIQESLNPDAETAEEEPAEEEPAEEEEEETAEEEEGALAVGTRVSTEINDEVYEGEVSAIAGETVTVLFDDGDELDMPLDELTVLGASEDAEEEAAEEEEKEESGEKESETSIETFFDTETIKILDSIEIVYEKKGAKAELDEYLALLEKVLPVMMESEDISDEDKEWLSLYSEYLNDADVPLEERYRTYCAAFIDTENETLSEELETPIVGDQGILFVNGLPATKVPSGKFTVVDATDDYDADAEVDAEETTVVFDPIAEEYWLAYRTEDTKVFVTTKVKKAVKKAAVAKKTVRKMVRRK